MTAYELLPPLPSAVAFAVMLVVVNVGKRKPAPRDIFDTRD
jgi:hypothetical protein